MRQSDEETSASSLAGFVCPWCHRPLTSTSSALECPSCQRGYSVRNGIPCFAPEDDFYEGRWAEPDRTAGSVRNILVKKERFFWRHLRHQRGTVLDLGCGGGWRLYTRVGPVAGVDISVRSLQAARTVYGTVAQATLDRLPFPADSFDFVVSSDVLGHVPLPGKDAMLAEMRRVLRPGGLTLHYVEAEGDDPAMRFARRYPELYYRYVLEPEGHIGLERADDIFARFRRAGFHPREELAVYRGPTYVRRVGQYFDNEYRRESRLIAGMVAISKALSIAKPVELAANLGITALLEITDRWFPRRWAGGALVCYQK